MRKCAAGRRFFLLFSVVAAGLLSSCATANLKATVEDFDRSTREFGRMLRWGEFENACGRFIAPNLIKDCVRRAEEYRTVSITDVRSQKTELDPVAGKATVRWEIEYFILPSNVVKTAEYSQRWENMQAGNNRIWFATNLPPELDVKQ